MLTPKSKGKTPAVEAGAASAAKSAGPRSAAATGGRSRLSQAGPSMAPAAFAVDDGEEEVEEEGLERTQEIELPQASVRKAAGPVSASRRRSLSRTPGTKIVIIERGTGGRGTPVSAAKQRVEVGMCC